MQRIRIGSDATPPALEPVSDVDSATRERALAHVAEALSNASGAPIEHHATGFGSIIVARIAEPEYLAIAIGSAWPMSVLEVHRMDRSNGSTKAVKGPADLTALDVPGLLALYHEMKGARHVDA